MTSQWDQNTKAGQEFWGNTFGKNQPAPPDFTGAAQQQANQQAQLNRPNQVGPVGSLSYSTDPTTGQVTQTQGFTGQFADMFNNLGGQANQAMGAPLDFSGLPELDYGEGAFKKATDAAFGQAKSRLDPYWDQQDEALDAKLAAQGLAPDTEAGRNARRQFGEGRTDAYNQALFGALREGRAAGEGVFRQSQAARQQKLAEMLQKRGGPLAELSQLMSLNKPAGFMPVQGPNLLGALGLKSEDDWRRYDSSRMDIGELLNALGNLIPG